MKMDTIPIFKLQMQEKDVMMTLEVKGGLRSL